MSKVHCDRGGMRSRSEDLGLFAHTGPFPLPCSPACSLQCEVALSKWWEGHNGHVVIPLAPGEEGGYHDAGPGSTQTHGPPHREKGLNLLPREQGQDKDCMGSLSPPYCTTHHFVSSGIPKVYLFPQTVSSRKLVAPYPILVTIRQTPAGT